MVLWDGDSGQKDYYVSLLYILPPFLCARVMGEEDPERCRIYKERAMLLKTFIYWFDEDAGGAALRQIPFTYRFAQVSFWSACPMAGV